MSSKTPDSSPPLDTHDLLRLADQCVKCGYCLPHCPTYAKTRNEADSPRGRIALIQGWVSGGLRLSSALEQHLDGCLGCRACETVCPSLVAYGQLADAAKSRRVSRLSRSQQRRLRLGLGLLSSARVMRLVAPIARVYAMPSRLLEPLIRRGPHKLRAYHRLAIAIARSARPPVTASPKGATCELFVGCAGSIAQGAAISAALQTLGRLGVQTAVSSESLCCGATMRHGGFPQDADRYRARAARSGAGRRLVGLASACIAELREQPGLEDTAELCAYIEEAGWPKGLKLEPLDRSVLVHEPCTHRNLLGGTQAVYALLRRIPQLRVAPLPGNDQCCGAAGAYMIQQPKMALALGDDKLSTIEHCPPDLIVTTNPGCALHLLAGARERGLPTQVCHPIELIARQLPRD